MIIFLYGEDSFRSSRKVAEIKNKFLLSDKSGSGLSVFDSEEEKEPAGKIVNTLNTANIFASKRLVICKDLIYKGSIDEQKKILDFLKKRKLNDDKEEVVVFWEGTSPKKNNALYKFLQSSLSGAKSQNFEKLTGIKLEVWALKTMREINGEAKISKSALAKLIVYCGEDNFLLFSEIQKLLAYADGEMIDEKSVDLLVRSNLNNNIFLTVDALGGNNKKEALRLIHEHLEKGEDGFYLLSMFFYQFRNMLKVADIFERGIHLEYEIARTTKLHPFVVKKTLSQMRNFSLQKLKNIFQKLSELDMQAKTGKIEIKLALDKFVAEL